MSYIRFDRHANMSDEVRGEILDLISDVEGFDLTNMLYGLFDGYLYKELDKVQNPKLQSILSIIKQYPILNC
jgi:DNA-binding phage protein